MNYKKVVETANSFIGYQGDQYDSYFTEFLDSIDWYNYKKAGACTWCMIFYDYLIAVNKGSLTYEQARQIVCEPADHKENSGAGAKEHAQMYKNAGRWITSPSKATTGDEIFYKNSSGIYHGGIVIDWDSSGFWVIEGSTTYNGKPHSVGKKHISFNDSKIAGFGRPDWYKFDTDPDKEVNITIKVNAPDGVKVNINIEKE